MIAAAPAAAVSVRVVRFGIWQEWSLAVASSVLPSLRFPFASRRRRCGALLPGSE
jgi:hypothetical protein